MISFEAVEANLRMSHVVTTALLSDLSDDDLLARPVPEANHIAWQLGHLISSEHSLISRFAPGVARAFPPGWQDGYTDASAKLNEASRFERKARYIAMYDAQRQATLDAFKSLDAAALSKPTEGPLRDICRDVAQLFLFQAHHEMMHAGQFTTIRRHLGKPRLF